MNPALSITLIFFISSFLFSSVILKARTEIARVRCHEDFMVSICGGFNLLALLWSCFCDGLHGETLAIVVFICWWMFSLRQYVLQHVVIIYICPKLSNTGEMVIQQNKQDVSCAVTKTMFGSFFHHHQSLSGWTAWGINSILGQWAWSERKTQQVNWVIISAEQSRFFKNCYLLWGLV